MREVPSKSGRKLGAGKIHYPTLLRMKYTEHKETQEIAEYFGVTTQAISSALSRVHKDAAVELYSRGQDFIDRNLTVQGVLIGLMNDATELLSRLRGIIEQDDSLDKPGIEKRTLLLKTMAEVRAQLKDYADIQSKLYSAEAQEHFQRIVVEAISEVDEDVAKKIRSKLQRNQPLRQFIGRAGSQ